MTLVAYIEDRGKLEFVLAWTIDVALASKCQTSSQWQGPTIPPYSTSAMNSTGCGPNARARKLAEAYWYGKGSFRELAKRYETSIGTVQRGALATSSSKAATTTVRIIIGYFSSQAVSQTVEPPNAYLSAEAAVV